MKKVLRRTAAIFAVAVGLTVIPEGAVAHACPDPEGHPCDPQTIDPVRELKDLYCRIKGC